MQQKPKFSNVIFDFDSTLIQFESLEYVMKSLLGDNSHQLQRIESITNAGMNGEISFRESLDQRLQVAKPTKKSLQLFVEQYCPMALTEGISELVARLHSQNTKVFIISGGFRALILPFAKALNIVPEQVYAVELNWDRNGQFKSLNNDNGFCDSKVLGGQKIKCELQGNTVIVGDGFTDYALYQAGIADEFIAYTEHVVRQKVIEIAPFCAKNIMQLSALLGL